MYDHRIREAASHIPSFSGLIVPLVTPFRGRDEVVDLDALGTLVDYALDQGADALMPTALTGEGSLLDDRETVEIWECVLDRARGIRPVIPTVIATTTRRAQNLVRVADERGAAAVMVAPVLPELYTGRSADDVYAFYAEVASATSRPLILFNYPSLTGVDLVPPLVARLAELSNVCAVKESTGDVSRVHAIQRLVGDRLSVICGAPNVALESLALGCRGWITAILNAVPRSGGQLVFAVHELADLKLARDIYYRQILPLVDVLQRNGKPTATVKAALRARGLDVGVPRRPAGDVSASDRRAIEQLMRDVMKAEANTEGLLGERHAARLTPSDVERVT